MPSGSITTDPPRFVDEPTHAWALANRRFLEAVFAEFDTNSVWPEVDVLQRRLVRAGERLNVSEAAYALPQLLGHLRSMDVDSPSDRHIVLTPFALRYVDDARPLLDHFVQFLQFAVSRYLEAPDEGDVVMKRDDLVELGLSDGEAVKLSYLLLTGGASFLGGGRIDIDSWELTVHQPGLVPLLDIHDIDGYLSVVVGSRTSGTAPIAAIGDTSTTPDFDEEGWSSLHPAISTACKPLFEDGHYAEAVERGYKVVRDRLRSLTGFETGSEAFGRGKLEVAGAAAPHVENDFNAGVKFLTMAIDKFRNEKSHSSDGHTDVPERAREYISMSSLAMHLLDQAKLSE